VLEVEFILWDRLYSNLLPNGKRVEEKGHCLLYKFAFGRLENDPLNSLF
jgi:hypothetical protein